MDAWLEDPYFVGWLSKIKSDKSKHVAPSATKLLNYHQVGDHAKGKKRVDVVVKRKNFKSKSS